MNKILLLALSCLVLAACSSDPAQTETETSFKEGTTIFTGLFVKRGVSLRVLLGPKFTVEDIYTKEQSSYNVNFDKPTRMSFITEVQTGDTVWVGYADRGNTIWMLETPISDTTFHASALAIDNGILYGFRQLAAQQVILDQMLDEGKMDHLIVGGDEDQRICKADRIVMQPFLESALSKLEPRFKLIDKADNKPNIKSVVTSATSDVDGNIKIVFRQAGDYIIEITSDRGGKTTAETGGFVEFTMNAGEAKSKNMLMTIIRRTTGEEVEKMKIAISK
jgi:hypothetical protein